MDRKTTVGDILTDVLLAFLFAAPASYIYNSVLEHTVKVPTVLLVCFIAVAASALFLHVRAARHAMLTAGGLYILILLIQLLLPKIALIKLPVYTMEEIMQSKAVAVLIAVVCSIFAYILVHYSMFFAFYAFVYVLSLAVLTEIGYKFSVKILLIVTASLLLILFRKNYIRFFRQRPVLSHPVKRFIAALLATAILCTGVYILCSKRPQLLSEPLLGEEISKKLTEKINGGQNISGPAHFDFSDGSFNLSGLGFGSADHLGGDANPSDEPILYVLPDSPNSVGIYLHGTSYVNYTGLGWTKDKLTKQSYDSCAELFDAQISASESYMTDYKNIALYVRHASILETRQIFTPMNTMSVEFPNNSFSDSLPKILATDGMIPYANKNVPSDFTYCIAAKVFYPEKMTNTQKRIFSEGFYKNYANSYYKRVLSTYTNNVRDEYLALPTELPDRIVQLAKKLTKSCANDSEKALAIQEFLTSKENGFEYTLTPGASPSDADFVDYFLFETRKGYCTYYASAMTVLLRAAGVPARYAEGFYLSGSEERNNAGYYILRVSNAHAWCEVFLEGLGFVPFEATPTYGSSSATPTHEKLTPKPTNTPDTTEEPEITASPEPTAEETPTYAATPEPTSVPTEEPHMPQKQKESRNKTVIPIIISLSVILAVCAVLYFRSSAYIISKVKCSSPDKAVSAAYRYLSGRTNIKKGSSETIREFADKVKASDKLSEAQHKSFEVISDMYERSLYGSDAVREEDKESMIQCIRTFK